MISEGSLHGSKLRNKKKNEYKYNLYSMLDEPLNNGCNTGCFSNNEFCASKIPNHQWSWWFRLQFYECFIDYIVMYHFFFSVVLRSRLIILRANPFS